MVTIATGKPADGHFSYLNEIEKLCNLKSSAKTIEEFSNLDHLDTCLAIRAAHIVRDVVKKLSKKDIKKKVAINDLYAQDLLAMSKAHHMYLSFLIYIEAVRSTKFSDPKIRPLLELLGKIFCLKQLSLDSVALYETGFFTQGSKALILDSMKQLLVELRPHMIPLVELKSDELLDWSHMSAIGNKYGDIYERYLELAMNSRLNKQPKPEYWDSLVKPLMAGKL
jgi:hypothetical protein